VGDHSEAKTSSEEPSMRTRVIKGVCFKLQGRGSTQRFAKDLK
jgi:hypothetical protein